MSREDELWEGLASGTLTHISVLREHSAALLKEQNACINRTVRKQALREDLVTVLEKHRGKRTAGREKREEERAGKVKKVRIGTVAEWIAERNLVRTEGAQARNKFTTGEQRSKMNEFVEVEARGSAIKRELVDIVLAYRLSGVSLFRTQAIDSKDRLLGLRFDTSFKGKYYERYYVIFKPSGKSQMKVHRHIFPHFVPVESLFNKRSLKDFIQVVKSYVNAFVSRRQQTKEVEEKLGVSVYSSASFDIVTISGVRKLSGATVTMAFDSLLDTIPSRVSLEFPKSRRKGFDLELDSVDTGLELTLSGIVDECLRSI